MNGNINNINNKICQNYGEFIEEVNNIQEKYDRDEVDFLLGNGKRVLNILKAEAKQHRAEIFESEKEIRKLFKEIDQINRSFDKKYNKCMCLPFAKAIREEQETRRLLKEIDAIDREYMRVYNEYNRSPCAAACRAEAQGNDCEARE